MAIRARIRHLSCIAALFAFTLAVYSPGLNGPFLFDDVANITGVEAMKMSELSASGVRDALFAWGERYPHRGLARLSFALNYYFADQQFDNAAFKLTNVVIHGFNGLLVYWLGVFLLQCRAGTARLSPAPAGSSGMPLYLPLVAAALWLLHPIQLTSVLYVVQRMTSMAALFVLLGLLAFVAGRIRLQSGRPHGLALMFVGLAGGVGFGFLCKQNAVMLPFYAFLVEVFFFRHETLSLAARRGLYGFYGLTVAVPVLLAIAGLVGGWEYIEAGYLGRDFSPWERLLTQSRVLFFYLGQLLFPHIHGFGLYHDDFPLSTGLLDPWTTLPAMGFWVLLAGLAIWGAKRRALWSFAVLWFLVGHALESSVLSLELVYEHRNYLPSLGILIALTCYLSKGLQRLIGSRVLQQVILGLLIGVLAFITFARAGLWNDKQTLIEASLRNHPNSSRTHGEYALLNARYLRNLDLAYEHWARAAQLNRSSVLELIEMDKVLVVEISGREERGVSANANGAQVAPPKDFSAPVVTDLEYLRALDSLVAAEISERLAMRAMSNDNVASLNAMERCIRSVQPSCLILLPRAVRWFELAGDNPRVGQRAQAVVLLGLAKLHAYSGRIEKAVRSAEAAASTDPGRIQFLIELSALYLELGKLEAAQRSISAAEALLNYSGHRRGTVENLKRTLERARSAQK